MAETVITFLRARLDEDERVAMTATPGPWASRAGSGDFWIEQAEDVGGHMIAEASHCAEHPDRRDADTMHIARHDPARALAEVAAKRQMLDLALEAIQDQATFHVGDAGLRLLLMPYAGHSDYREEWR